jgi:hypothetical protein
MIAVEPRPCPPHWPPLISAVRDPESVLSKRGEEWEAFLGLLEENGLLPLACRALRESGMAGRLAPGDKARMDARMAAYLARWMVKWEEVGRLLRLLVKADLRPIVLKGAHLAMRGYPEPHLRPFADLDVLFASLGEAERAQERLEEDGYMPLLPPPAGETWALLQHLPVLGHPRTGFPVEVHGSLIYPPRDARWLGGACKLLERREYFDFQGMSLESLSPEASVAYLCAHAFIQHKEEPPKAILAFDLASVLDRAGDAFDWVRLKEIALAGNFGECVHRGLAALGPTGVAVPAEILAELAPGREVRELTYQGELAQKVVEQVVNASGFLGGVRVVRQRLCPVADSLRVRYPHLTGWPTFALYPVHWAKQGAILLRWVLERQVPRRRGRQPGT